MVPSSSTLMPWWSTFLPAAGVRCTCRAARGSAASAHRRCHAAARADGRGRRARGARCLSRAARRGGAQRRAWPRTVSFALYSGSVSGFPLSPFTVTGARAVVGANSRSIVHSGPSRPCRNDCGGARGQNREAQRCVRAAPRHRAAARDATRARAASRACCARRRGRDAHHGCAARDARSRPAMPPLARRCAFRRRPCRAPRCAPRTRSLPRRRGYGLVDGLGRGRGQGARPQAGPPAA